MVWLLPRLTLFLNSSDDLSSWINTINELHSIWAYFSIDFGELGDLTKPDDTQQDSSTICSLLSSKMKLLQLQQNENLNCSTKLNCLLLSFLFRESTNLSANATVLPALLWYRYSSFSMGTIFI